MLTDGAIVVADRSEAGRILCSRRRCAAFGYLLSIGGFAEREPAGFRNCRTRLRLVFEDAETPEEGGPTSADVERIVEFARRVDLATGKVLVQCQAGISRSAAAHLF